ncbi:chromosome partitioning protein ParA [Pseudoalteromonas xiamenensis]|uniref:chromosome partitioning protein ParA n=1 Tax=Pseudoalteromonas xiamenensis TaxID=882626 RepID=UPI0027E53757|nr:chromosome partitioning protein ParA [Pseudoalteromonas xiamenensis]WMN60438.1 chromosome partitioning protein ParA [Pseudoalteromonas xiamenensis]
MWQTAISGTVIQGLIGNLGLLILAGWFLILLLILREFRHFIHNTTSSRGQDDSEILAMCRESVDNALSYVKSHADTISELAKIQLSLESQLAEVRSSSQTQISDQDQATIDELNRKLMRSHALIKKLKGDLDKSVEKLHVTRRKLYDQYETVESLQKEKEELLDKYAQLEQQLEEQSSATGSQSVQSLTLTFEQEKRDMLAALQNYRRQIAEQNQAIQQLELQHTTTANQGQVSEIKKELEQTQSALKHLTKEKNFIESKYLQLVKEYDKPSG